MPMDRRREQTRNTYDQKTTDPDTLCMHSGNRHSPPLRLDLKLSFLIKSIVMDSSSGTGTSHSFGAIGPRCWGNSYDVLLLTLNSFTLNVDNNDNNVHMTLLSLTSVSLSQQLSLAWWHCVCCPSFPVLSTPSRPKRMVALPESGRPSWVWFYQRFFLQKGCFLFFFHHCTVHA